MQDSFVHLLAKNRLFAVPVLFLPYGSMFPVPFPVHFVRFPTIELLPIVETEISYNQAQIVVYRPFFANDKAASEGFSIE